MSTYGSWAIGDNNFNNVAVLLHGFPWMNNDITFIDRTGKISTRYGSIIQSTEQYKWHSGSIKFNSASSQYLTFPNSTDLQLTGDFTIEAWIYRNATGVAHTIMSRGATTPTGWVFAVNASDQLSATYTSTTFTSTGILSANTWHHVSWTRSGSSNKLFINFTEDGSATDSTSFNQSVVLNIGCDRSNTNFFNGYMQDIRITKGIARYTGNFSPITEQFPDTELHNFNLLPDMYPRTRQINYLQRFTGSYAVPYDTTIYPPPSWFTGLISLVYKPSILATYNLLPNEYINDNVYYSADITTDYTITSTLYNNTNTFYIFFVSGPQTIAQDTLFTNTNTIYIPRVDNILGGDPPDLFFEEFVATERYFPWLFKG